ncbi:MAG: twin-arginine translocation signal domain-containing protein, partial [Anaerolineae bacterium]
MALKGIDRRDFIRGAAVLGLGAAA